MNLDQMAEMEEGWIQELLGIFANIEKRTYQAEWICGLGLRGW